MLEGMLLVNKPPGMTSHDVVLALRRKLGVQRIGHTGTLDPMAQGLLILLIGSATRRQQEFQAHEKVYEASVCLGTQTDTGDATGATMRTAPVPPLDQARLDATLAQFRGPISQTPPAYSAVKRHGRPAYWWARRDQPVTLPPRVVRIHDIVLRDWTDHTITLHLRCSAGTYVRTLAESIAERLGTVGHLSRLVRLRIGSWSLDDAQPLSWIMQAHTEQLSRALVPVTTRRSHQAVGA